MRTGLIAEKYGCHPGTILKYLKEWGVPIRKHRHNAIYTLDTHVFSDIDTEEKAYYVGLLLADGHLSKENHLMLTMKDEDILWKYQKFLKTNCKIKVDRYNNYFLNIRSKEIADDLRQIGFHNRKSYYIDLNKVISHISGNLLHHFVRGMFDGDGSIRIYHYDYFKNPSYHLGYTGLLNVVEFIKNYFKLETKLVQESEITYTCVTSCKQKIIEIFNLLYKDATVYIDRKYNTFLEII